MTVSYNTIVICRLSQAPGRMAYDLKSQCWCLPLFLSDLCSCLSGVRDIPFRRAFEEHRRALLLNLNGLLPFVDGATLVPGPFLE